MKRAALCLLALLVSGCDDPRGMTERFLTVEMKSLEAEGYAALPPLPQLRPRKTEKLRIDRDPFQR